jgi:hypothetical protein
MKQDITRGGEARMRWVLGEVIRRGGVDTL